MFACVCVYLQMCVSLRQQVLDLFGHGGEHQLKVRTFHLCQLLPPERQHRARILRHLQQGHFLRSHDKINVGPGEAWTNDPRRCEGSVNTQQRCICSQKEENPIHLEMLLPGKSVQKCLTNACKTNGYADRFEMSSGGRSMNSKQGGEHPSTQGEHLSPL